MNFRDIFEDVLGHERAYKCALWAFGEGFECIIREYLFTRWNDLHSDLFILKPNDELEQFIRKICAYWIMDKDKKTQSVCF